MSLTDATVDITVTVREDNTVAVRTVSGRDDTVAKTLTGTSLSSAAPKLLLTSVYALCPQAHLAAWEAASARAAAKAMPENAQRVAAETAAEHLRFLAFDAPRAVGLKPAHDVRRLGALRALMTQEFSAVKPDFAKIRAALTAETEHFITGPAAGFNALDSIPDFESWITHGQTPAAQLFSALWEQVPSRGILTTPALDPHSPADAETWFTPQFSAQNPTVRGKPRMTGALTRWKSHPLIADLDELYCCSVRTLFVARLIEIIRVLTDWAKTFDFVRAAAVAADTGVALVQSARGLLTHHIRLARDLNRVESVVIAAPTEWNFARHGAAEEALSKIEFFSEEDYRRQAAWMLAGIDACVPCRLHFEMPQTNGTTDEVSAHA